MEHKDARPKCQWCARAIGKMGTGVDKFCSQACEARWEQHCADHPYIGHYAKASPELRERIDRDGWAAYYEFAAALETARAAKQGARAR